MPGEELERAILTSQRNEITEHYIYEKLLDSMRDVHNRGILKRIAGDEKKHYEFWKEHTRREVKPNWLKIWKYYFLSRLFGITFAIKLMERGEEKAQANYNKITRAVQGAQDLEREEKEHERELIGMIDEERLRYVGSMVLGLNDALIELTGALAGFTLALQNTRLVAVVGFITGVAASLSMAASEYLSTKSEGGSRQPLKASLYTGTTYVLTAFLLILPYLIFSNYYICLGFTLLSALGLILIFSFYVAVAKDLPFGKRFLEMAGISLGIAALSFVMGYLVRTFLDIHI